MSATASRYIQPLESRLLLSGNVAVNSHGALNLKLDNHANTVTVGYSNAAGSAIVVNIDGVKTTIPQTGSKAQVVTLLHIHCGNGNDTVTITPGDGTSIKVFDKYTIIRGGAGHDHITTGNETDLIFGGAGYETITTGNGSDSIVGGSGHDSISVGNGEDYIVGGGTHATSGGDTITTGSGNDTVFGFAGDDNITLGSGIDTGYAGNGDTIKAGNARDTIYVANRAVVSITGTTNIKHVTRRSGKARWYSGYTAAIENAITLAATANNY